MSVYRGKSLIFLGHNPGLTYQGFCVRRSYCLQFARAMRYPQGGEGRRQIAISPRATFWRKPMVGRASNRQRKRRNLTSLLASSVMARSATRNRLLPVEQLSNFDRITPKHGKTSAQPTISSVATKKPLPPCEQALGYKPDCELARNNLRFAQEMMAKSRANKTQAAQPSR